MSGLSKTIVDPALARRCSAGAAWARVALWLPLAFGGLVSAPRSPKAAHLRLFRRARRNFAQSAELAGQGGPVAKS
jgi:hypothetical protein